MQTHQHYINSVYLRREVVLDSYFAGTSPYILLLVNDGQELPGMLGNLPATVMAVGIHAGAARKEEYGTAAYRITWGRGSRRATIPVLLRRSCCHSCNNCIPV